MKIRTAWSILAVLSLCLGLGMTIYGISKSRAASKAAAAWQDRQASLDTAIRRAQENLVSIKPAKPRPQEKPKPASAATPQRGMTPKREQGILYKHPKLLELYLRSFRANLRRDYAPFYKTAGLSPDRIAKFEDLMTNQRAAAIDLNGSAADRGLKNTDPAIATLREQQNDQLRSDQVAVLGDGGYQELQQYNRSQIALQAANTAAQLAPYPNYYTSDQVGQLTKIIANASSRFQQGGAASATTIDWDSAVSQAATVLSPAQLTDFKATAQMLRLAVMTQNFAQPPGR